MNEEFFGEKLFEKSFSPLFKNFCRIFYSTLDWNRFHSGSFFHALRFGKSVDAVQILLDFSLSYADGNIAPASVWVPPPPNAPQS